MKNNEKEVVIMRIESSAVAMQSGRTYELERELTQTSIQRGYGAQSGRTIVSANTSRQTVRERSGEESLYAAASVQNKRELKTAAQKDLPEPEASAPKRDWLDEVQNAIDRDPKVQILRKCLELLDRLSGRSGFGYGISHSVERMEQSITAVAARYRQTMSGGEALVPSGPGNPNGYWTRQTVASGFTRGEEHTAFQSSGSVVTSDGRRIDFGISLEMSRSFESAFAFASKEEVYTDPLVINLDTDAASLSDVSFYFDLDCDGKAEELSALEDGSGFLALDRNGDGKINDGSELFGTRSGDGFADLAQYDGDGNGWIDENDDIFSNLSVWTQCGGEPKLLSLKEAGVGAIFLGSSNTQFGLDDPDGESRGVIRRTGLYLRETGEAGTVQHLDYKM